MFSDYNGAKLETNNIKIIENPSKHLETEWHTSK